mmetsp:Transcript_60381/g.162844  ORF Transcript_60381/g.162844 Transcript_60381/m.162844 type:complete len:255 (-) Transcript_60381:566-1330(-)
MVWLPSSSKVSKTFLTSSSARASELRYHRLKTSNEMMGWSRVRRRKAVSTAALFSLTPILTRRPWISSAFSMPSSLRSSFLKVSSKLPLTCTTAAMPAVSASDAFLLMSDTMPCRNLLGMFSMATSCDWIVGLREFFRPSLTSAGGSEPVRFNELGFRLVELTDLLPSSCAAAGAVSPPTGMEMAPVLSSTDPRCSSSPYMDTGTEPSADPGASAGASTAGAASITAGVGVPLTPFSLSLIQSSTWPLTFMKEQ